MSDSDTSTKTTYRIEHRYDDGTEFVIGMLKDYDDAVLVAKNLIELTSYGWKVIEHTVTRTNRIVFVGGMPSVLVVPRD